MAASLSRPDPTSPASVAEAGFSTSRRGYQPDEVRAFLTAVASEMGRLKERERQLDAELRAEKALAPEPVELDDVTVTNLLGEETLRVLQTARESANQIKVRAEENAARVMREAHDEANRLRQEAEVEAARQRHDAQSDAEAEVAIAKQQGREMVTEARAYRERVLADLERRTRVARQHIDELSNGRDRLLQVFERARLVAVDITTELQRVDGPDEYVSFAPTTGPVPLMVPAGKLDAGEGDDSVPSDDDDPVAAAERRQLRRDVGSPSSRCRPRADQAAESAEPPPPVETIEATEPPEGEAPGTTDEAAPPAP